MTTFGVVIPAAHLDSRHAQAIYPAFEEVAWPLPVAIFALYPLIRLWGLLDIPITARTLYPVSEIADAQPCSSPDSSRRGTL